MSFIFKWLILYYRQVISEFHMMRSDDFTGHLVILYVRLYL